MRSRFASFVMMQGVSLFEGVYPPFTAGNRVCNTEVIENRGGTIALLARLPGGDGG